MVGSAQSGVWPRAMDAESCGILRWLYVDPEGSRNILFEAVRDSENKMFGKPEKGLKREQWDDITDSDFEKLEL